MLLKYKSRLTSSTILQVSYIFVLLCICQRCISEEDISLNVVSDHVESGNPYPLLDGHSRGTHNVRGLKRKHPNHFRTELPDVHVHSPQPVPASDEAEPHSTADSNAIRRDRPRGSKNHARHRNRVASSNSQHETNGEEHVEPCPMCASARQNAQVMENLDEETLWALRVEIVKQQILKKLGLKEPPVVPDVLVAENVIPQIALGSHLSPVHDQKVRHEQDEHSNMDLEDFYGKTEQIIVLPQEELSQCVSSDNEVSSCYVFNLPKEVRSKQISGAMLWGYNHEGNHSDNSSPTGVDSFSVSEGFYHYNRGNRKPIAQYHVIASQQDVPDSRRWINFNITDTARKWLNMEVHEHTIKIQCTNCNNGRGQDSSEKEPEQQPFIVFNIANERRRRRHRRSLNCTPGVTECCRESLHISFRDIKWNWVIEPKDFNAYYCKGRCHGNSALTRSVTRHATVMMDYVANQGAVTNATAELLPCCTATEMDSFDMMYRVQSSDNSTVTFQRVKLPNMVVKSCGCK